MGKGDSGNLFCCTLDAPSTAWAASALPRLAGHVVTRTFAAVACKEGRVVPDPRLHDNRVRPGGHTPCP